MKDTENALGRLLWGGATAGEPQGPLLLLGKRPPTGGPQSHLGQGELQAFIPPWRIDSAGAQFSPAKLNPRLGKVRGCLC